MRRPFLAGLVAASVLVLVQCSKTTELVVAVDTDLAPGIEVDTIHVSVDAPSGRVFDEDAEVRNASALPLTLGVQAGSDDEAEVHVVATASKSGTPVARTEVFARMTDGESRLVQVSICRSCGLACGRDLGSALPEWNDSLPARNACETTFADAGGFDSGRPPSGDAMTDAPVEDAPISTDAPDDGPFDASVCGSSCPAGTTCKALGCEVGGEPTCAANTIEIPTATMRIVGKVCAATSTGTKMCTGAAPDVKTHAFVATGNVNVKVVGVAQTIRLNKVDSSCMQIGGTTCASLGTGASVGRTLAAGEHLAIGYEGASGCGDYRIEVTAP